MVGFYIWSACHSIIKHFKHNTHLTALKLREGEKKLVFNRLAKQDLTMFLLNSQAQMASTLFTQPQPVTLYHRSDSGGRTGAVKTVFAWSKGRHMLVNMDNLRQ